MLHKDPLPHLVLTFPEVFGSGWTPLLNISIQLLPEQLRWVKVGWLGCPFHYRQHYHLPLQKSLAQLKKKKDNMAWNSWQAVYITVAIPIILLHSLKKKKKRLNLASTVCLSSVSLSIKGSFRKLKTLHYQKNSLDLYYLCWRTFQNDTNGFNNIKTCP